MGGGHITGLFLQARVGSLRLPGKALLPLAGRPVLEHVMAALGEVATDRRLLLTDADSEAHFAPVAKRCGFGLLVGSDWDVLGRYCDAIAATGVCCVIRATGDNPLVSASLAESAAARFRALGCHHFIFEGMPLGMGVEIVDAEALLRAGREATAQYDREHVTSFLYGHSECFRIVREPAPAPYRLPTARVTIDLWEDYRFIRQIFADLYRRAPIPAERLIPWLAARSDETNDPADS